MAKELDRILENSDRTLFLDDVKSDILDKRRKGLLITIENLPDGDYNIHVYSIGVEFNYEAFGILEAAKWTLQQQELQCGAVDPEEPE